MNPLELIQQYTSNIIKSAVMLKHLGCDSFPLPTMEEVINIKNELISIHPADITAKLAWDDYKCKERFIRDSFKGFLEIDGCGDAVRIDNELYLYWDGLTKKLIKRTEKMEEVTAQKYIDDYSTLIWEISCAIHDTTKGMKADINYLFNDEAHPEDSTEELNLPQDLCTDKANKYFALAVERGYMERTSTGGFKWLLSKTLLAFFCGIIFCNDDVRKSRFGSKWMLGKGSVFPDAPLCKIFGVDNLGQLRLNELNVDREKSAPRGFEKIWDLFKD